MRYQLRLLGRNLPRFTREIAQACWHATDGMVPRTLGNALYRDLYRAIRDVFRQHVTAFRYCNSSPVCDRSIPRNVLDRLPRHEKFAGEHVHVYLIDPDAPPDLLAREIVSKAVHAAAHMFPGTPLHGLAAQVRAAVEKRLEGCIFPSQACSEHQLCFANEAYDPWDLRDPINAIRPAW